MDKQCLSEACSAWRWQKLGQTEKQGIREKFQEDGHYDATMKGKLKDNLANLS